MNSYQKLKRERREEAKEYARGLGIRVKSTKRKTKRK